jgi:dihydrofolate reductase
MRKIKLATYVSLDGVVENPGWTTPFWNDELGALQKSLLFASDALLLGRVTYEGFASAWPTMTDEEGFADRMNALPKFVASTTLDQGEWNATILKGDLAAEVAALKEQPGQDLLLYASGDLADWLTQHGLIDEYRLMVFPVFVGAGKRIFDNVTPTTLRLVDTTTTSKGVAVMDYRPVADDPT